MTPVLSIRGLGKAFGGLRALEDVDLDVAEGEILSVIGPNGAGKTTLFNIVTGILRPTVGTIRFGGEDLLRHSPPLGLPFLQSRRRSVADVTRLGIARTFQNIRLFPEMTALENVLVAVDSGAKRGLADVLLSTRGQVRESEEARRFALDLMDFCGIRRLAPHMAKHLSYGDQRRLEIARALGTRPRLLLLDEPAAGMNRSEQTALMRLVRDVRASGITVLLIEHEMKIVMEVSDRIAVLDFGRKIAEGTAAEVQRDERVIAAYLGMSAGRSEVAVKAAEAPAPGVAAPILELKDLRVNYGAVEAVKGISLKVERGESVCLIGSNGAGKTTVLKTISGLLAPSAGAILFRGQPIGGLPAHKVVRLGIAHSPEGRRVLGRMTVLENLQLAFRESGATEPEAEALGRVLDLLPLLRERLHAPAAALSGGQQQMLAIGRAIVGRPSLLMLDEPSMGLAPMMVERIFEIVRDINRQGTTVLLVEQNANMALSATSRGYVIESGTIVLEDRSEQLLGNDLVRRAYLGESLEEAAHA